MDRFKTYDGKRFVGFLPLPPLSVSHHPVLPNKLKPQLW